MDNGGVNCHNSIAWAVQSGINNTGGPNVRDSAVQQFAATQYLLISTFYGLQVNTLNGIAVHDDRWRQRIRPKPKLPNQVYSFDPATKDVRVIADGFGHPNGITFSSDQNSISLVVQRPMVRALRKITCLQLVC